MSDAVLEQYIRQYIEGQPVPEVYFAWQGGEPTLLGVEFFQKAVQLQQKYAGNRIIANALQTNGTLLDDAWCEFLAEEKFLVGLSIDGPREAHDKYRVDKGRKPTFDAVMRGLGLLKKHGVEFNTLTVVHRANARQPLEVYRFLKEIGSEFLQFIPLVERAAAARSERRGWSSPSLPSRGKRAACPRRSRRRAWRRSSTASFFARSLTSGSGGTWGGFLCNYLMWRWGTGWGWDRRLCVFAEKCGAALALEHNGDLYSCDHYVYPKYRLGNILNQSLGAMARSAGKGNLGTRSSIRCRGIAANARCDSPATASAPSIGSCGRRTGRTG